MIKANTSELMGTKIAIVEDEQAIQQMYKAKLELHGFVVETANNGSTGLELIKNFRPKLALIDLRMPTMSGDEMLKKIREKRWGASIRVVILTNLSKDEAPLTLRLLNVDRYVVKAHYTPAQVVSIVQEVLGIKAS